MALGMGKFHVTIYHENNYHDNRYYHYSIKIALKLQIMNEILW